MSNSTNKLVILERKTREERLKQASSRANLDVLIEQAFAPKIVEPEDVAGLEDRKCPECEKEFEYNKTRNKHMKKEHKIALNSKPGRISTGGKSASNARYYDKTKEKKTPSPPKTSKQIRKHKAYIKQKNKKVREYLMESILNRYQGKNLNKMYGDRAHQQTADADYKYSVRMGEQFEEIFGQNDLEDTYHNRSTLMKTILSSLNKMFPHFISASYVEDEVLPVLTFSDKENLTVPLGQESESFLMSLRRFFRSEKGKEFEIHYQLLALDYLYFLFASKEFDAEKIKSEYPTLYSLFNKYPFFKKKKAL